MESIVISGIIAALAAILATVSIEKFGGRIGGLIGTLPSTIVPASIGFWAAQSSVFDFQSALYAVPTGMVINAIFLFSWRWLPLRLPATSYRTQLCLMILFSLTIWLVVALSMLMTLRLFNERPLINGLLFFFLGVCLGVWGCRHRVPSPKGSQKISGIVLLSRGAFASLAIGLAVWISSIGLPIAAGLASVFPAIFLTTMVSVWISQGEAVVVGAVGPMMLGGVSVSAFALLAAWLFPLIGPWWGSCAAWLFSAIFVSAPAWAWLSKRIP